MPTYTYIYTVIHTYITYVRRLSLSLSRDLGEKNDTAKDRKVSHRGYMLWDGIDVDCTQTFVFGDRIH